MTDNILDIRIGPEALIFSTQEQRNELYDIWLHEHGVRAWSEKAAHGTNILFETNAGAKGHITASGDVVWQDR